jgi:hypothetical protein
MVTQKVQVGQFLLQPVVNRCKFLPGMTGQVGVQRDLARFEERLDRLEFGHQVTADLFNPHR